MNCPTCGSPGYGPCYHGQLAAMGSGLWGPGSTYGLANAAIQAKMNEQMLNLRRPSRTLEVRDVNHHLDTKSGQLAAAAEANTPPKP